MLSEERKLKILNYINTKHAVTATDLMEKFNASEATIRRDLTEMDKKGLISKVHGGAVSIQNQIANAQQKLQELCKSNVINIFLKNMEQKVNFKN